MYNTFAIDTQLLQPCPSPPSFSFFSLIALLWEGEKTLSHPLHRFCTLMRKMQAQSFVHEVLVKNQELQDEEEMASAQYDGRVRVTATRLTFFSSCPGSRQWNDHQELPDDHLLGYAVIATFHLPKRSKRTFLLEAVVKPPSMPYKNEFEPVTNYYIHCARRFQTSIGPEGSSRTFPLTGCFFTQQNGLTSVCAHAALRMAINNATFLNGEKLTNKRINEILGIDFSTPSRAVNTKRGLTSEEIGYVITKLNGYALIAHFTKEPALEYDRFIYPLVESGYPVILGISGWNLEERRKIDHAVTVIGHTLNSDRWEPEARQGYGMFPVELYIPVTGWVDHYLIHDDNFGMYITVPSDMLRNYVIPFKNPNLHATVAIGITANETKLWGSSANQIAAWIAQRLIMQIDSPSPFEWLEYMRKERDAKLVCRTLLQTKEVYIAHIRELLQEAKVKLTPQQQQRFQNLPDHFWVSEISLPHIYTGNKHKLGDILLRSDVPCTDASQIKDILILAWVPGYIRFGFRHISENDPKIETWGLTQHVPFIRSTGISPRLEW